MTQLTKFGKTVKVKLIRIEKNVDWLSEAVKEKTGLFCDRSYLSKIFHGTRKAPKIVEAIEEILALKK